MRILCLSALVVAVLAAGCGGIRETPSGTPQVVPLVAAGPVVSREQVVRAFAQQGFTLVPDKRPWLLEGGGQVLAPYEPFMVFVAKSPELAQRRFEPSSRHVLSAFNLIRKNVFVLSTADLPADMRARIVAAMNSLGR